VSACRRRVKAKQNIYSVCSRSDASFCASKALRRSDAFGLLDLKKSVCRQESWFARMKKAVKPFKVEVKRRPGKSNAPFLPEPQDERSGAIFKSGATFKNEFSALLKSEEELDAKPASAESIGRVLPCLVSEAAVENAQAQSLADAEARLHDEQKVRRPVGRPKKIADADAPARPRGRPKKQAGAPSTRTADHTRKVIDFIERFTRDDDAPAVAPVRSTAARPPQQPQSLNVSVSARRQARRELLANLPRGQRWKKRLPEALW
jgi:hypothetical protein